jgi:biotin carboxyl carrier protein
MARSRTRGIVPVKRVIRINGAPVEPADADLVETEPGVYSILMGGASYEARVSGDEIIIGGNRYAFEMDDPRQWTHSRHTTGPHGRAAIVAAMPGKIVRILVGVGDEVEAGQGIVVIEAMKMQNELKAPQHGRVTAINVKENESVNAGTILATIE